MAKLTPIQQSFSAGEISPLMYQRSDTEGYMQGLAELTNMFADSRGPVFSRSGMRYTDTYLGDDARIMALPVNDLFFYTAIFNNEKLTIGTLAGHNPLVSYSDNSNFNARGDNWTVATDGHATSKATFEQGAVTLEVDDANNRYVYITQQVTLPAVGNYSILWAIVSNTTTTLKVGTAPDDGTYYNAATASSRHKATFTAGATTVWLTARIDSDNVSELSSTLGYLGISTENAIPVDFVTPYQEQDLAALHGVQSPSGSAIYILHERYPPYKIVYDRATDTIAFELVTFVGQPIEWEVGSYPSCGDFFEGRLWLGGTVHEPQTFWASKSGIPEDFTQGANADDGMEFTMAKYGRIEWMVGFKNLVIGTQNGEHIVTSEGGFIKPDDIQVQQQSSYGSANVQPVQVGDQIFYVSSDGRKLRAIQYEWQKDNWLSQDLTFNSEHITAAGIRHVTWQQNPANLFHCVLNDGTVATLTYERAKNVYGWAKVESQGRILDVTTGPLQGTDHANVLIQYVDGAFNYESQSHVQNRQYMDSWVLRNPEADSVTITGLEHLNGFECQVLVNEAVHPDRTVVNGEITLAYEANELDEVIVGLGFTCRLVTLPISEKMRSGDSAPYIKRWNKIYIRTIDSALPLINGERSPERFPSTPMNTPQPNVNQDIFKVNTGFDRYGQITIEQDLARPLTIIGVMGELAQSIT